MFGQVGFARWGDAVLPALIVSPNDVPMGEGSPREKWLGMFNNVSALSLFFGIIRIEAGDRRRT
jgi:hypothetical protein